jgi:MFS family permease
MEVRKPTWTTASFLLYTGGLTVLVAAIGSLAYLSVYYGKGALVAWALLPLVVLIAVAFALRRRGRWIAAGVFAFSWVAVWAGFLGILFTWWGWNIDAGNSAFAGWHWVLWVLLLLVVAAAAALLRVFRFPFLFPYVLVGLWFIVTDVVSGGGTWTAVVTLVIGILYLLVGVVVDRGSGRAYGFWWHLVGGLLIGGSLLFWWHSTEADWSLVATASVLYILVGGATWRSSWAVLGVGGAFAAAIHWTIEWVNVGFSIFAPNRTWVPFVVFAVVGFFLVVLGLYVDWRRRRGEVVVPVAQ